jgi:UvrD-like helicase C-terminal domain/AAA domain
MARMIPTLSDAQIHLYRTQGKGAEMDFYIACRDRTPDEWAAIWHIPFIALNRGNRVDGEADFVLLVPEFGLLAIEIKGGTVGFNAEQGWYSIDGRGRTHAIRDPFQQALDEKHAILKFLKSNPKWLKSHKGWLLCGHSVFFTAVAGRDLQSAVRPESPFEILGGTDDLARLENWVRRVFQFWKGEERSRTAPLTAEAVETAIQLLVPPCELRPPLKSRLAAEEAIRITLTAEQGRIWRTLRNVPQAAVCGGAGTGKTLLAMNRAKELAAEGKRTLLLCFNRLLGDHMRADAHGTKNLWCGTYHAFCGQYLEEAAAKTGVDYRALAAREFPGENPLDIQMPFALTRAIQRHDSRYDAILIDEAQDFRQEYWLGIRNLLCDRGQSQFYVFYDDNQNLYRLPESFPFRRETHIALSKNCRNTIPIHDFAYRFYTGDPTDPPENIDGEPVGTIAAPTLAAQATALHERIVALILQHKIEPERIVVLIGQPGKRAYFDALGRLPLPPCAKYTPEGPALAKGIRLDTVKSFKGLESDYVFLWGIDDVSESEHRELLYVGSSRAKARLYLVGTEETCRILHSKPGI